MKCSVTYDKVDRKVTLGCSVKDILPNYAYYLLTYLCIPTNAIIYFEKDNNKAYFLSKNGGDEYIWESA